MIVNKPKKRAKISLIITILSASMILYVISGNVDIMDGGGALIMLSILSGVTSFIFAIFEFMNSLRFNNALENNIIHIKYSTKEWNEYLGKNQKIDSEEKKSIYYVICFFAILFGILFMIFDFEAGKYVAIVMLILIILFGLLTVFTPKLSYKNKLDKPIDTVISKNGLSFYGTWYSFNSFMSRLERVKAYDNMLEFHISIPMIYAKYFYQRQHHYIRVPIPKEIDIKELKNKITLAKA